MFSTAKTLLRQRLYLLAKKFLLAERLQTEHGWDWRYAWHVAGHGAAACPGDGPRDPGGRMSTPFVQAVSAFVLLAVLGQVIVWGAYLSLIVARSGIANVHTAAGLSVGWVALGVFAALIVYVIESSS
jgi:hypothetical protein